MRKYKRRPKDKKSRHGLRAVPLFFLSFFRHLGRYHIRPFAQEPRYPAAPRYYEACWWSVDASALPMGERSVPPVAR